MKDNMKLLQCNAVITAMEVENGIVVTYFSCDLDFLCCNSPFLLSHKLLYQKKAFTTFFHFFLSGVITPCLWERGNFFLL